MDDIPILGNNRETGIFNQVMALYGAPAYVRRARQMEQAWDLLVDYCRKRRDEELELVRMRLAVLRAVAGEWTALRPLLADDEQLAVLQRLEAELRPVLQHPLEPACSSRQLRRVLGELLDSLQRFNQRWLALLARVDLTEVNQLREGYNHFYVFEKECAVSSPRVARQGFRPMAPATTADLTVVLPVLPMPQAAGGLAS